MATGSSAWVPSIVGAKSINGTLSTRSPKGTSGWHFLRQFEYLKSDPPTLRPGLYVYRTVEDVTMIMDKCRDNCRSALVIGGGLLGLEAAKACYDMAVPDVHVVQNSSKLMSRQLDQVRTSPGSTLHNRA